MKTNVIFNMQEDTCMLTDTGRVRKQNEDNMGYAETPNGDVFVVCDGMGGHVGGKVASSIAVDAIMEYFGSEKKLYITDAMDEAIRYANRKIFEKAEAEPELSGMGTTIVLVVIQEDKTYIAHVGDSRIYLFSNNKLYRVTKDHSHVQQLIDIGAITPEEAETHPKKNIILKALGIQADVEPEVAPEPLLLKNGDTLLLCSDGLSDMVNDSTIESVLQKGNDVKKTGDELLQLALNAGGKDNITLQLVRITNSNYKESVFVDKTNKPAPKPEDTDTDEKTPVPEEPGLPPVEEKKSLLKKLLGRKGLLFGIAGLIIVVAGALGGMSYFGRNSRIEKGKVAKDKGEKISIFALRDGVAEPKDLSDQLIDSVSIDDFVEKFFKQDSFVFNEVKYDVLVIFEGDKVKKQHQRLDSLSLVIGVNGIKPTLLNCFAVFDSAKKMLNSIDSGYSEIFVMNGSEIKKWKKIGAGNVEKEEQEKLTKDTVSTVSVEK